MDKSMTDWQQLCLDAMRYATHSPKCHWYSAIRCTCGYKAMKDKVEAAYWASERGKAELERLYQPKEDKEN